MLTNLMHPSNLLVAGLIIVLAEFGGATLVTVLVLAVRRLRPVPATAPASSWRGQSRRS